jgi:hypothetical protein
MTLTDTLPHGWRAEPHIPPSPRPSHTRSQSLSSDQPSTGFGSLQSPLSMASPEPVYIAASAASQIVTNDQDARSDAWFDQNGIEPSGETALVSPSALKLVNSFLDQLLFNFLSIARSTSLASLRPAVTEALKPKLAKDAILNADQELQEYLGGGDDEELLAFHNGIEPSGDLDLELLWKRTRLRCMVYSSLGDMEEEDEDHWTEHEQLDGPPGSNSNRFSGSQSVVSPAVAIFLTSILEFMGEQTLIVAGQAAHHRLRAKHDKEVRDGVHTPNEIADRMVVDELDMERVALDRTLGRLWRGWKKRIRSPAAGASMSRSFSRESMRSRGQSRRGSIGNENLVPMIDEADRRPSITEAPENEMLEHERAATIPLPLYENDIREIEVPGLAHHSDDEDEDSKPEADAQKPRPKSLVIPRDVGAPLTPTASEPNTPLFSSTSRKRSNSLPSPATSASVSPPKKQKGAQVEVENVQIVAPEGRKHMAESVEEATEELSVSSENEASDELGNDSMLEGAVATAVIATVVKGEALATAETPGDETDIEDLDDEEPQVMTSSRISLDRTVSPDHPLTRASSVHSHSVHSVKLVDVPSPRSPTRSRHNSVGSLDQFTAGRSLSLSRSNSVHSPVIVDAQILRGSSPVQRGTNASPILRNSPSLSAKAARNSAADSISEYAEIEAETTNSSSRAATPSAMIIPERSPLREVVLLDSSGEGTPDSEKPNMSANTPLFGEPEPAFVLDDAPVTRSLRPIAATVQHHASSAHSNFKTPDSGVPPLTPLREMMEGAPDTSDEASSIAPSDGQSDAHGQSSVVSGSAGSPNYRSVESKSLETPRSTPRSLNVRTPPSQVQRDDDATPRLDRTQRRLHTSGSSTSSGSHKVRPIRTSEESMPSTGEDKSKSFEQLLHNDQTIQYTLTPREIEVYIYNNLSSTIAKLKQPPDSPRHARLPSLSNASDTPRPPTGRSANRSINSNSTPPMLVARSVAAPPSKPLVAAHRQVVNTASKVRPSAPQARDARIERDSMGDFADFIRSTGPPGVSLNDIPRSVHNEAGHRGQNGTLRNTSVPAPRSGPVSVPSPRRSDSSAGRIKLQARDAVVPVRDNTSDLIDFIRQGPPNANPHENPRIPRTVAPFRTTMDSDQMSGAIGNRSAELSPTDGRYSQASNDPSMQSMHSSMNSQSALINAHKSTAKTSPRRYDSFEEESMIPKRKTRRVQDPYAIDFSDDEDDDDDDVSQLLSEPRRDQESLVDFLKNVPPPTTSSVFDDVPKPVGKKSSHPGLMSRFSRTPTPQSHKSNSSRPATRPKNDAPQVPPSHIPITINSKYLSENQPSSTHRTAPTANYVSRLDIQRKPVGAFGGRVQQKSFEPRDATNTHISRGTSDLADFLMNTPPPPSNEPQGLPYVATGGAEKETSHSSGGFSRMFARRKKIAA